MSTVPVTSSDLQILINERFVERMEKAKATRLEDLQRIASLNSANENGRNPLVHLPVEMWKKVFSYVVEPQDLQNAWSTCPLFQNLLEDRRLGEILLPQLLQLPEFKSRFRNSRHQLSQLVPLRSVCKSWRNVLDRFFERELTLAELSNDPRANPPCFLPILHLEAPIAPTNLGVLETLRSSFLKEDPLSAKRFVTKSLRLHIAYFLDDDNLRENFHPFQTLLETVLGQIGGQILSFEFAISSIDNLVESGMAVASLYTVLKTWIEMMPNLKFLRIQVRGDSEDFGWLPPPRKLLEAIQSQPFPTLRDLKRLQLQFQCGFIQNNGLHIYEAILKANLHLKDLIILGRFDRNMGSFLRTVHSLPLESLSIKSEAYDAIRDMQIVLNTQWPLNQLKVEIWDGEVSSRRLFAFLEQFPTLERLHLGVMGTHLKDDKGSGTLPRLNLDRLREFGYFKIGLCTSELSDPGISLSLDYLLGSKELEKILWISWPVRGLYQDGEISEDRKELIQFNGGTVNMPKSNIWRIFPNLKSVQCGNVKAEIFGYKIYRKGGGITK